MASLTELISRCHQSGEVKFTAPVLQEAIEARNNQATKLAAVVCADLIGGFEKCLKGAVQRLRELRAAEAKQAECVKKIDRAFRFFGETGNPLPMFDTMGNRNGASLFCGSLNIERPGQDDAAWTVPAEWKPAE
jgi:hypothetical protein